MTREEIENKIIQVLDENHLWKLDVYAPLTDLFIELSDERCIDQRMIADDEYHKVCFEHDEHISDAILNAPLPEIN